MFPSVQHTKYKLELNCTRESYQSSHQLRGNLRHMWWWRQPTEEDTKLTAQTETWTEGKLNFNTNWTNELTGQMREPKGRQGAVGLMKAETGNRTRDWTPADSGVIDLEFCNAGSGTRA